MKENIYSSPETDLLFLEVKIEMYSLMCILLCVVGCVISITANIRDIQQGLTRSKERVVNETCGRMGPL